MRYSNASLQLDGDNTALSDTTNTPATAGTGSPPRAMEPLANEVTGGDDSTGSQADGQDRSLDRRWIVVSRVAGAFTFVVVFVVASAVAIAAAVAVSLPWDLLVLLAWTGLLALTAVIAFWWPKWSYSHWSYRVDSRVAELRFGVLWQNSVAIPISRLQHVDLHRGPLERRWGLASLQIHTAGTRDASHTIPGLDDVTATRLRDRLIDAVNRGQHDRAATD